MGKVTTKDQEFDCAIGARIKARRLSAKMSQTELADCIGVSFQQMQKYERGINRLSAAAVVRVAAALGIATQELLETNPIFGAARMIEVKSADALALLRAFEMITSPEERAVTIQLVTILSQKLA